MFPNAAFIAMYLLPVSFNFPAFGAVVGAMVGSLGILFLVRQIGPKDAGPPPDAP
ncbi:MAG TPA: hypothetical protein VGM05_05980 [Planctomycetaceae bacterium]